MMRTLMILAALAACGGSGDDDASDNPDAPPIDAPGTVGRARAGYVEVLEDVWTFPEDQGGETYRTSRVDARFFDGDEPSFHREAMRAGDCVLSTFTPASCSQPCNGVCVETDVCQPWPTYLSAGRLTLAGLRTALSIEPMDGWYFPSMPLPPDLFADDASVTATLAGAGAIPSLILTTSATPPLAADVTGGKVVAPFPATGPLEIRWTPAAGSSARVRLTLNSNNRGHGAPFDAIIECDVADDAGVIAVPAAMLDAFPATEAWTICAGSDCPPSRLRRYRNALAPVGERDVELRVSSTFTFGIEHRRPQP